MSIVEILSVGFFPIAVIAGLFAVWLDRKTCIEEGAFLGYWGVIAAYSLVWYIVSYRAIHIG